MELMLIIVAVVMLVPVLVLWIDDERDHMRHMH